MTNIIKNSLYNLGGSLFSSIFLFISFIIFSRLLGPEPLGIFQIQLLIITVLGVIFISFIDYSLAYNISKSKSPEEKVEFFSISLFLSSLIGITIAVLMFFLDKTILSILNIPIDFLQESLILFHYFIIYFLVQIFLSNVRALLFANNNFKSRFYLTLLQRFSISFFSVILYLLTMRLSFISLGFLIGSIPSIIFAFVLLYKSKYLTFSFVRLDNIRKFFNYGKFTFAINVGNQIQTFFDSFLISILLGPIQVGFYSVAYNLFNELNRIPKLVSESAFPKLLSSDRTYSKIIFNKILKYLSFVQIPLSIVLLVFSKEIITLIYGSTYSPSFIVFSILSSSLLFSHYWVSNIILLSNNKPLKMTLSLFFSIIFNILLNLFLIPKYGIIGAAVSTLISFVVYYSISSLYLGKEYFYKKNFLRDSLLIFFSLIFLIFLKYLFLKILSFPETIGLLIVVTFYLISYTYLLYSIFITKEDKEFFISLLNLK